MESIPWPRPMIIALMTVVSGAFFLPETKDRRVQ